MAPARLALALVAVCVIVTGFLAAPVVADTFGSSGGLATSLADTLYCKLTGCTMTGTETFSGVTTDITTGTNEDLKVNPNGTGVVDLAAGNGSTTGVKIHTGADSTGMTLIAGGAGSAVAKAESGNGTMRVGNDGEIGSSVDAAATTLVGYFGDNLSAGSGGNNLFGAYGSGLLASGVVQTGTCSAAVLTLDPQSATATIDSNAADCTLTVNTTSVTSIAKETSMVRITAKNVGAGHLKIASTNFASIPTRCSSTGLAAGQSALIAWSQDQAKWTFLGGCE
jgi:hypothetical protein